MKRAGLVAWAAWASGIAACSADSPTITADSGTDASTDVALEASNDGGASEKLVWVGAHPDDELYAAPWLAHECVERKVACTFLVLTRGEKGTCKLPACNPDLATLRDQELVKSSQIYGATLVHWDLGDGTAGTLDNVLKNWDAKKGGTLVADVAKLLSGATAIVSFDPRHGDSCHADHRAAGALAILARRTDPKLPYVTMVASKQVLAPAVPADAAVVAFDASALLPSVGKSAWSFLVLTMQTHASQFTPAEVSQVASAPPAQQRTFLLSEKDALDADPRYANLCP